MISIHIIENVIKKPDKLHSADITMSIHHHINNQSDQSILSQLFVHL